jgi:sphingolipid delta-4 desaturase
LFGYDRRTAWVTLGLVAVQLSFAAAVGREARAGRWSGHWWVFLAGAYLVGAPLTHWLAMAIHETSHRLATKTVVGNNALALLANVPMVLPFALTFNRYHLEHHRALNVLGLDTDLPLPFEVQWVRHSTPRKLIWVLLHPIVYLVRGATFAKPPNRGELLNWLLIGAADLAIARLLGGWALGYLGLSFFFALGLHPVAAHFIHEHYAFAGGQETFSYYGPLNWITFNVGYHNEHHDFMNVPGWRLPALRRLVPDYDALVSHRSWTGVLWHFITDRRLGYGSRIVRTREVFERGRATLSRKKAMRAGMGPAAHSGRVVLQ